MFFVFPCIHVYFRCEFLKIITKYDYIGYVYTWNSTKPVTLCASVKDMTSVGCVYIYGMHVLRDNAY
jgi:hypothetical protein